MKHLAALVLGALTLHAREARASCIGPEPCVCSYSGSSDAAVIVALTEVDGMTAKGTIESIATSGSATVLLAKGDAVDVDVPKGSATGDRLLGLVAIGCETGFGSDCSVEDPSRIELVSFYRSIDVNGLVGCSFDRSHRFDAEEAMAALVTDDCVGTLDDYVPPGAPCDDTSCSMPARPTSPCSPGSIAALMLAYALARRRRSRR